jgi:hypothetical protein
MFFLQEYIRVVYDIFPPDTDELKLIRMVVSDVQVPLDFIARLKIYN